MAQQNKSQHRETEGNGLAHGIDTSVKSAAKTVSGWRPELQGYAMLAAGAALLLFAFGFFPMIKWVIVAAAVGLLVWGTVRSDIFAKTSHFIERLRAKY
jgi:hypothetical protein